MTYNGIIIDNRAADLDNRQFKLSCGP